MGIWAADRLHMGKDNRFAVFAGGHFEVAPTKHGTDRSPLGTHEMRKFDLALTFHRSIIDEQTSNLHD
jgi:hypothetical protein